ncbi:zinc-ribbon domain-containing protein [Microbacterium sp. NPDC058269]|uniref:zinc-ribbon domain-containing protein n=1 Tax=Microbacterium sp. NPDC058269 TaxID=3346414 RepID=UPI0036DBA9E6
MVAAGRIDVRLHTRAWEMVRDNARLTRADSWKNIADGTPYGNEARASLFPEIVSVLAALSDGDNLKRWGTLSSTSLRSDIAATIGTAYGATNVLVERVVLWLRPLRRRTVKTRFDPLCSPLDLVDAAAIIDVTAPYPKWVQSNPKAVAEWDWRRNSSTRDPWDSDGVTKDAWWVCDQGHSWEASPFTRGYAVTRCPYCAGQMVWPGHTDLRTVRPDVAAEWDTAPGHNVGDPDHVGPRSTRRVHWRCRRGHGWNATIRNRTLLDHRCPYCVGTRPIPGETDLATLRPDIAKDWDPTRNAGLTPSMVKPGSSKKAWWTSSCGHSWRAGIHDRTRKDGTGCPYCSNRSVLVGFNDIATTHPQMTLEWDASNDKKPTEVTAGSAYSASWMCDGGHVWRARVYSRVRDASGCPFCANCAVLQGFNDLATVHPKLASQWHTAHGVNDRKPTEVTSGSQYRASWICLKGHTWRAEVVSRSSGGHGCPYCSGHRAIPGETDLSTLRPELAAEWDIANELSPAQVTVSSNRNMAWRCSTDHVWHATVSNRSKGSGCPYCAGQRPIPGETDLATLQPDLAAEWDASNSLSPQQVTRFSNRTAAWKCSNGHTWSSIIAQRSSGSGCPVCYRERRRKADSDRS